MKTQIPNVINYNKLGNKTEKASITKFKSKLESLNLMWYIWQKNPTMPPSITQG